jgi:hypothetical protein
MKSPEYIYVHIYPLRSYLTENSSRISYKVSLVNNSHKNNRHIF